MASMKVIYPQETLALLAECDKHLEEIRQEYLQPLDDLLPSDPVLRAARLANPAYQAYISEKAHRQQRALLTDVFYQAWMRQKARIISLSTCTYQFDTDEVSRFDGTTKPDTA